MMSEDINEQTRVPAHPGTFFYRQFMEEGDVSVEEMADKLNIEESEFREFINGNIALYRESMEKIAQVTGTTIDLWLRLQTMHYIRKTESEGTP